LSGALAPLFFLMRPARAHQKKARRAAGFQVRSR